MNTLHRVQETTVALVGTIPIDFGRFLQTFGEDGDLELIDGVVVQRMSAQLDHERLCVWLMALFTREVDYRTVGVEEIWLTDRPRQCGRVVQRLDEQYQQVELTSGHLQCRLIPQIRLKVDWLLGDERPPVTELLRENSL